MRPKRKAGKAVEGAEEAGSALGLVETTPDRPLTRAERRLKQPGGCRTLMRNKLAEAFPAIVEGFVKAAKTGSVPHVKLATELLKPTRKGSTRKEGSAAKIWREMNEGRE